MRAASAGGESAWSPSTTMAPGAPATPTAPTLTAGNGSLSMAWTAPTAHGSAITDYDVRVRSSGSSQWDYRSVANYRPGELGNFKPSDGSTGAALDLGTVSLTGVTVTKPTISGVSNVYRLGSAVGMLRLNLTGKNARQGTRVYTARYATSAPTSSNMNTHGTLLWSQSVGDGHYVGGDGWTPPLPAGSHFWITTTTEGRTDIVKPHIAADDNSLTARSYTLSGLTNGTAYEAQVRAANARGEGGWSASATMTPGTPVAPTAPTLTSGGASLGVSWTAPTDNGSAVTDYDVQYRACTATPASCAANPAWGVWTALTGAADPGTATTAAITGLTNGTAYQVRVRATNTHGGSPWGPSASRQAGAPSAPVAPGVVSGASQLTVTWQAPAANGSAITDYDVRYSSDSGSTWTQWQPAVTSTTASATITGPHQRHRLRSVRAGR